MYRDDFKTFFENKGRRFLFCEVLFNQVIGRGPRTAKRNLVISLRVDKTKNSESTAICFQQQKKVDLKTCSAKRHVFPLHFIYSQLSKYDHVIYGAAKIQTSRKTN